MAGRKDREVITDTDEFLEPAYARLFAAHAIAQDTMTRAAASDARMKLAAKKQPVQTAVPVADQFRKEVVRKALRTKGLSAPTAAALAQYTRVAHFLSHKGLDPSHKEVADHINAFSGKTMSQQQINEAARKLADTDLLERADKLLTGKELHQPLPEAAAPVAPAATPKNGFVALKPKATLEQQLDKTFGPGKIKPATDEVLPLVEGHTQTVRKKNRERDAVAPAALSPDGALPLADGPDEAKTPATKSHRAVILRHAVNRVPEGEIAKRLAEENGIHPSTAAKHVRAFFSTRHLAPHKVDTRVTKLAAKKAPGKPVTENKITVDAHPSLAGTRIAHHLASMATQFAGPIAHQDKPIAYHAKQILRNGAAAGGVKGVNGANHFVQLGKALEAEGHPLAKTYNWKTMGDSLAQDQKVKDFLAKTFTRPEGMRDREFLSKVIDRYSQEAGGADYINRRIGDKDAHRAAHAAFWDRIGKHFGGDPATINDSLYRLHALADDAEDFERAPDLKDVDKPFNTAAAGKGTGNKALKFSRGLSEEHLAALAILAKLDPGLAAALTNRGVKL